MELISFYVKGIIVLLFGGSLVLLALTYLQSFFKHVSLRPLLEYLSIAVQVAILSATYRGRLALEVESDVGYTEV